MASPTSSSGVDLRSPTAHDQPPKVEDMQVVLTLQMRKHTECMMSERNA